MNILYYEVNMPIKECLRIFRQVECIAGETIAIPKDWHFLENCSDDQLRLVMGNLMQMVNSINKTLENKKKDAE